MKRLIVAVMVLVVGGFAGAARPALAQMKGSREPRAESREVRTIQQSLDVIATEETRVKSRPTDFPPAASGGGGQIGPYGLTCAEARERLRWSDLPCAVGMPQR
ncbi:MAG: hypothetical protein ABSD47_01315 [Candidatus Methylomirabilota bacterium]|jgi:hypothetical protein